MTASDDRPHAPPQTRLAIEITKPPSPREARDAPLEEVQMQTHGLQDPVRALAPKSPASSRTVLALAIGFTMLVADITTAASSGATATTTNRFVPVADSHDDEATPSTNFGNAKRLGSDGAAGRRVETEIRFSVSGIAGVVTSAKLRLHIGGDPTSDGPLVFVTSGDWTERGVVWNTRTQPLGSAVADFGALAANAWAEVDVTSSIAGNGKVNFLLRQTSTDGVTFDSREKPGYKPELVVTTADAVSTTTPDTTPPTALGSFAVTTQTASSATVGWSASSDNVGVAGYGLYRDGALVATTTSAASTYTGLACGTSYTLAVDAYDAAGNRSAKRATTAAMGACPAAAASSIKYRYAFSNR